MGENGAVLFQKGQLSGTSDEDNEEDIWDDRLLIEAYDRAVNCAKEKVAASSSETNLVGGGGLRPPLGKTSNENQQVKPKGPDVSNWKEGMFCRCVYSGDNQEYEATIKSLSPAKGTCRVVYYGYNNEEEVQLSRLKRSKGEKARKKQQLQSECPEMQQDETNGRPADFQTGFPSMEFTNSSHQRVLPPPPPPQVMSHFPKDESDALSAMLMSWYMSGYHTGYYQGLTRSRRKEKGYPSQN